MNLKKLARKVERRLSKYAITFFGSIPVNTKYKPVGVKKLLPNNNPSVDYLEIRPPYESTLDLPQTFVSDCSHFAKPEMSIQIPGDYLVTLKNGRVCSYDESNYAVLTEDNYLIDELSYHWNSDGEKMADASENKVLTLKGFTRPKKIKGTVFSLLGGGGAKYYYYHWMIDSLARLGLLKESGRFDEVDYFLVPNYSARYHKETLNHFGITEDKIINQEFAQHVQADRLIVSSYTQIKFHHPKWACDFLHNSFTTPKLETVKRDRLIYIPRGDAGVNRRVLNEHELMDVLKEYGFETRFLSDMAVPDEAEYFNSAKLVLGAQGSGFTNLVFCEPGTKVIQFFPANYVRHIDYDLSNKMGLEFHYLLCQSDGNASDTLQGQKIHVIADIPAIRAKLDMLLNEIQLNQNQVC